STRPASTAPPAALSKQRRASNWPEVPARGDEFLACASLAFPELCRWQLFDLQLAEVGHGFRTAEQSKAADRECLIRVGVIDHNLAVDQHAEAPALCDDLEREPLAGLYGGPGSAGQNKRRDHPTLEVSGEGEGAGEGSNALGIPDGDRIGLVADGPVVGRAATQEQRAVRAF